MQQLYSYIEIVKKKWHLIVIAILVGLLFVAMSDKSKEIIKSTAQKVENTKQLQDAICETPKNVNFVVQESEILKNGNFVIFDLNTFENFKTKRIDENRNAYYYRRTTGINNEKQFVTLFKYEPLKK